MYRGEIYPWVKGPVPVLLRNFHHRGERGEKGGSANFIYFTVLHRSINLTIHIPCLGVGNPGLGCHVLESAL